MTDPTRPDVDVLPPARVNYRKFMEWVGMNGPRPSNAELAFYLEIVVGHRDEVDAVEMAVFLEAIELLKFTPTSGEAAEGVKSYQEIKQEYRDMLAPPKPAPDGIREALEKIIAIDQIEKRICVETDPAGNTYTTVLVDGLCAQKARVALALVAPVPSLNRAREQEFAARLSASEVACYRWPDNADMRQAFCDGAAHIALFPLDARAAEPWQNIDRIIDVLEAAGCCRNGQVMSSEDHVANTIRDWLRSLYAAPQVRGAHEP